MTEAFLIIFMQFIIVPLTTLRTIFVVKGKVKLASALGGIEAFIYVLSLGIVFSDFSNHLNKVAYAVGYAGGILLGGKIEKKLAIGYRTVMVNLLDKNEDLVETLRNRGFGVTVFEGEGMDKEKRYRIDILVNRNREKELMEILEQKAPKAFVVTYEPMNLKGGYLVKRMQQKKTFSEDR